MESYSILYRLRAVHDYFDGNPCPSLQCHLTPQGEALAHRRSLLFRQTAAGEWALLSDNLPAEDDVLTLDLFLTDPAFMLYTAWQGFQPSAAYCLELPAAEEETEAATAIRPTDKKRGIGRGFCTVTLQMTKALLEAAKAGKPMQATLRFRAPSLQWEYVFIPRGETDIPSGRMSLEDAAGKVKFSAFKECETYGQIALRTVSRSRIPMRQSYGCKLRLTAQDEGRQKRILLKQVPPPQPGQFADAGKGILRQVCYY